MVLEGIAALSLASSIVQFVDFGCRLFSESKDLYESSSGSLREDEVLKEVANSLTRMTNDLTSSSWDHHGPSSSISDFVSIAQSCQEIGNKILDALNQLNTGRVQGKRQCLRKTFERVWKYDKINDMVRRLELLSSQVTLHLVKDLGSRQGALLSMLEMLSEKNTCGFKSLKDAILVAADNVGMIHGSLQDINQQKDDLMSAISEQLTELSLKLDDMNRAVAEVHRKTAECMLESLRYSRMEARHQNIVNAHGQTFAWILTPQSASNDCLDHNNIVEWMSNGTGIFWVAGKAGSGKFTLMKFLDDRPRTNEYLGRWSGDMDLITASFYFWFAGTELQKSQEGLLRTLLYKVLSQRPELMPTVLPERWQKLCQAQRSVYTDHPTTSWTRGELVNALADVSTQVTLKKRFCIFIDGLDEYGGSHSEIVQLIQELAMCKNVKVCVSSRPWNVFQRAFGSGRYPMIHLEDLTRQDIKHYVQSSLLDSDLFREIEIDEPQRCAELVQELVNKAQGVFLWVFLVVRSLLEGLTNADRIIDLEARVRYLPGDLRRCFEHMFSTIDEVYKEQTVKTFLLATEASEPLTLMTFAVVDDMLDKPGGALALPARSMNKLEIEKKHTQTRFRINARCKGLLEVSGKIRHAIDGAARCIARQQTEMRLDEHESLGCQNGKEMYIGYELPITNVRYPERSSSTFFDGSIFSATGRLAKFREHPAKVDRSNGPEPATVEALNYCHLTPKSHYGEILTPFPFFEYEVDFLHRTVRDFLCEKEMQDTLRTRTPKGFDPRRTLCEAFLAQIKLMPLEGHCLYWTLSDLLADLTCYGSALEIDLGVSVTDLKEDLLSTLDQLLCRHLEQTARQDTLE